MQDSYFIAEGVIPLFEPSIRTGHAVGEVAKFFDINESRASDLFVPSLYNGYGTRKDVLAALRVLLLEKVAQHEEWGGLTKSPVEELADAE